MVIDNNIGIKPSGLIETKMSEISDHLIPTLSLEVPNTKIRVCKRNFSNNSALYFITNEDTSKTTSKLQFNESYPIFQLDPETGKIWIPSNAIQTSAGWEIDLNLEFAGSCVFFFTNEPLPVFPDPSFSDKEIQFITNGWKYRKTIEFRIGEHGMEIFKNNDELHADIELGDWRKVIGDFYSGDVEYLVEFNCDSIVALDAKVLDLGKVRYGCQVKLNGEPLGKRIWAPFSYDIQGKIKNGDNILKVTVTNTLANQYVFTDVLDKWSKNQLGPYHQRQLEFEKESVTSGLFGPVTIK
jgi:hypothetical protein